MKLSISTFRRFCSVLLILGLLAAFSGCTPVPEAPTASAAPSETVVKTAQPVFPTESQPVTEAPRVTETPSVTETPVPGASVQPMAAFSLSEVPDYSGSPYCIVHDNIPFFEESELTGEAYETYHELDALGRCGAASASIGLELMPTESRGSIGQVKPTGWQTAKYDFVDGKYLYNRCHLIGWQLTAENANRQNLITGTRYLNVMGMLPFENMTADYIKETGNHVLYRVTPIFEGDNLVACGVLMEAESVEDQGDGVLFCVFCYNVQPGVIIDYATGESCDASEIAEEDIQTYVLNTGSRKFHLPACSSVAKISAENRQDYEGSRELLIAQGYSPCGSCKP